MFSVDAWADGHAHAQVDGHAHVDDYDYDHVDVRGQLRWRGAQLPRTT